MDGRKVTRITGMESMMVRIVILSRWPNSNDVE